MKKPAAARKRSVSNPYLSKAKNTGKNHLPSPTVEKPTITVKKIRFTNVKGV